MANKIEFNCLPTMIGSMPHTDAAAACAIMAKYCRDLPAWPQLPRRAWQENMYAQYSEGFPGIVSENGKQYVDQAGEFDTQLENLYNASAENNPEGYGMTAEYAAGLHAFQALKEKSPLAVKGQVTGPVSWGLGVTDRGQRGILYDELLAETVAKFLRLKAAWQERFLRTISKNTVIFIDEPYLTSLGTAFVAISSERVSELLEQVLGGISGPKGIHCCGTTDWPILLKSTADILSFDAYNYADALACYPAEVKAFLGRGSTIAWGIVTNDEEPLARESAASLSDRFGEAVAPFTRDGITFRQVIAQSIITPSCGLASLSFEAAEKALQLLAELSARIRGRYGS